MTAHAWSRAGALALLGVALSLVSLWSLTLGSSTMTPAESLAALTSDGETRAHYVMTTVRLPRLLVGLLAGAALAVAGAIMQAVTSNPLASPGLLGVNAGAAFGAVLATAFFGGEASGFYIWAAFAGAAVAAVVVYAVGASGRGGATPLKLALAGAILSAFTAALTTAILIFDKGTLDDVRMWTIGSLSGRSLESVAEIAPYIAAGLLASLVFRGQITTLSLGPEVARSVGQNLPLWRAVSGFMVVLLAGGAVSLAGPVGFVGLVVPHMVRFFTGVDYRWILPFCAVSGALLVVGTDAALRHALPGRDLPVGVSMALIGAPFFIALARSRIGDRA